MRFNFKKPERNTNSVPSKYENNSITKGRNQTKEEIFLKQFDQLSRKKNLFNNSN